MLQYATDHDDQFMALATGVDNEIVPAVDPETGEVADHSARAGFAVLIQGGYVNNYRMFICQSSGDVLPEIGDAPGQMTLDPMNAIACNLILRPEWCSYGYDITKSHAAYPQCAILADKPSDYVVDNYGALSPGDMGTSKHNSDNHGGEGQNVFYNSGYVKWSATSAPDDGDDPDIYVGGPGYATSYTDARVIR